MHSHSMSGGSIWASRGCQCCFWIAGWLVSYLTMWLLTLRLIKNSIYNQEKLKLNLHSLSVSERKTLRVKPVFHFKRTVPKRIKNVFKFHWKFRECWLVSTSVVRQKVDLRRTFYFDTRIHPEVRGFINIFSICACSPIRYGTIRANIYIYIFRII
jgi:hypothetical protein